MTRADRLDAVSRDRLNLLRVCALECRAARRLGLPEARDRIEGADPAARAQALVRILPEALGRRPAIRRPGEPILSFDEAWLLALLAAGARGDAASAAFLLRSRALPGSRGAVATLAQGLAGAGTGVESARRLAM